MLFRNITFYRLPSGLVSALKAVEATEAGISGWLAEHPAKPCAPLELTSRGWVAPMRENESLAPVIESCAWIALGGETKILPAAAVKLAVAKKVAAEDGPVGGRARKRIRDEVIHDLLPRALVKPFRVDAFIDLRDGYLAVNSGSRREADSLVSELRQTFGTFPALPVNAESSPRAVLTGWLYEGTPSWLGLGECVELRDSVDKGAVVKCLRQDLGTEEIRQHLDGGLSVVRLEVVGTAMGFIYSEDLALRSINWAPECSEVDQDDLQAGLFLILVSAVRDVFEGLSQSFRFSTCTDSSPVHLFPAAEQAEMDTAMGNLQDMLAEDGTSAEFTGPNGFGVRIDANGVTPIDGSGDDPLFNAAVEAVREGNSVSISLVQRRLKVGYNRAARLIETMEERKLVSVPDRVSGQRAWLGGAA